MDDQDVIDAFVKSGAVKSFGPTLHVEGDVLLLNGWWHVAVRVAPNVFIVRNEDPREESSVLGDMAATLAQQGLEEVGVDLPLIQAITYAQLSLGQMCWALWAPDLSSGQRALANKVGADSFLTDAPLFSDPPGTMPSKDFSAELGGARRVSGLPPSVILAVGLDESQEAFLAGAFDDCQLETRSLVDITPSACGTLIPSVIIVDTRSQSGREFVMELKTEACGRYLPVVALTDETEVPLGADVALDPRHEPSSWVEPLRALLP